MGKNKKKYNKLFIDFSRKCLWSIFIVLSPSLSFSQDPCDNIGFDDGNFSNWQGYIGCAPLAKNWQFPMPGTDPVHKRNCHYATGCCPILQWQSNGTNASILDSLSRHELMTSAAGNDTCGGFPIVPPGGGAYVARIGNMHVWGEAERIMRTINVTNANNTLLYKYAVVIQDPVGEQHTVQETPYFEAIVFDQNGDTIPCTHLFSYAENPGSGFLASPVCSTYDQLMSGPKLNSVARYKPWTTVVLDLSAYVGQTVTLRFTSSDCAKSGHFGYAYIDASCVASSLKDTLCEGETASFSAPAGATTYDWIGPGGFTASGQTMTIPNVALANAGNYQVNMTGGNVCSDKILYDLYVKPKPNPDFNFTTTVCQQDVPFTDNSTGNPDPIVSWEWNFGDGNTSIQQNPTHTYNGTGPYDVELIVTASNGCKDTLKKQVTLTSTAIADFVADTVCIGNATVFTDQSSGASGGPPATWNWDFGDGNTSTQQNPTHTYASAGTYNVRLIVTDGGCSDTVIKPVVVAPPPVADFTFSSACSNTVPFIDQSTGAAIDSWSWDFGDGNTSTQQNPTHVYSGSGTFNIRLIVSAGGCTDTIIKPITLGGVPVADFTASPLCLNQSTMFTDLSTSSGAPIDAWEWNFGEPSSGSNTSTLQNPSHTYLNHGTYNVTLIVKAGNCADTITKPVTIYPLPTASFSFNSPCEGNPTIFTDLSTIASGSIASWSWNFDDSISGSNNISSMQNPSHTYTSSGDKTVILTVTSDHGCQNSVSLVVKVYPNPVAYFKAPNVCINHETKFTDSSTINGGAIERWSWSFGDGGTSGLQNPSHTYSQSGSFNVTLTVSAGPCTDTYTIPVQVYPNPIANFTPDPVRTSVLTPDFVFTDLSVDGDSGSWSFGDGVDTSYVPGLRMKHRYAAENIPGGYEFDIVLDIVNQYKCPSKITKTVYLDPYWTFFIPDAFSPNGAGPEFNNFFYGKGIGILKYEMWIFDRWGNQLFHCDIEGNAGNEDGTDGLPADKRCRWDGAVHQQQLSPGLSGVQAQQDVYVWVVVLNDIFSKKHKYIGHVTLVK